MSKHRSSRKRLSDHQEIKDDIKKPKYSECLTNTQHGYKHRSVLPDVKELHTKHEISPYVKSNIDRGSYDNWEHYLNTHFNLLREDFVAPLRRAVLQYKSNDKLSCTEVYHQAVFTDMLLNEHGMLLAVKFKVESTSTFKPFINGTLLCFSSDNFRTILFATVISQREESNKEQLSALEIDQVIVKVESDVDNLSILGINESGRISSSQTYTMIESPAHYETYYHVLKSLQDVDSQKCHLKTILLVTGIK